MRREPSGYSAIEVDPADEALLGLIQQHSADITRFNPGFSVEEMGERTMAFIVQLGRDPAAIVVAHGVGFGRAQVDLDYALPAHRGRGAGEWVFQQSDVFARHGINKIVARADMQGEESAEYLKRIGFTLQNGELVLALAH